MAPAASSADSSLFSFAVLALYLISPLTILPLLLTAAPYGKHLRSGWGPSLPPAIAWLLMESPTLWLPLLLLPSGRHLSNPIALSILSLFLLHYINRTLIYPFRLLRVPAAGIPLSVAAMAFGFNLFNAYVQTRSATHYADYAWAGGIQAVARAAIGAAIGAAIFVWGMAVNVRSDLELLRLKAEGGGYKIPKGGWFELVSCPNYMGEVAEWFGWAVVARSPAAFGFALFTAANLVPRARAHHRWYVEKFGEDYPMARKAVVPYVL